MATTFYLSPIALIVQYFTNLGIIAPGALINTYLGGTVNTPVTTYSDSSGLFPNPNPMSASSAGRPASSSGAPVAFWVPGGTIVKLVVTDSTGANTLVYLDNIAALNDLTNVSNALQTLLASAASSNGSGVGPVAGADLVANAVKSYDVIADLRAANVPTLVTGQTLSVELQGGTTIGDGLGGFFYWSATSTAADDGRSVIKPSTSPATGRWLRYYPLGVPQIFVQAADLVISSSTALANTGLAVTLPPGIFLVSLRALLQGTGGTGQGWKLQPTFSGVLNSSTPNVGGLLSSSNGTTGTGELIVGTPSSGAALSATGDFASGDILLNITTGGVLTIQAAQNSSSANSTAFKAGSTMTVTRVS